MEHSGKPMVVPTGGCHDCGGRCVLKPHVVDGVIVRVETDDGDEPQLRACARGRAYRQRVYAPDRLKYPLRRAGARGEGKFVQIPWEEALDTVAAEIKRVKAAYGMSAILSAGYSGAVGVAQLYAGNLIGGVPVMRLLNLFGGCTAIWGGASGEGATLASRATYGTLNTGHSRDDLVNSELILMWGWNPANTIWSTNTSFYLAQAREAGARIICIDPVYTDSAATFADQWIPIIPGTDAALLIAMAYVMIGEELSDQAFLDRYTVGFGQFRDYVLGAEDGIAKTPAWAEKITGVPAPTIMQLAREYARTKPAALVPGFAPGRTAYGEQFHRAASVLAAMTGNVGIHGGNSAGFERAPVGNMAGRGIPLPRNPLEAGAPPLGGNLDVSLRNKFRVHVSKIWDAILKGKSGGYPADIKMLYVTGGNTLNQFLNTNKGVQALKKLEFIVVHEQFMTPTAKYADILLPVNTIWERNDIARPWNSGAYYLYLNKVINSMYESKSDLDICGELANRLGISGYNDKTEDEWLREIIATNEDLAREITDYDQFRKTGVVKIRTAEPVIAFKDQIEDPERNPFPTPSGKIEIFCQRLADVSDPGLPPIPKYIEPWEGRRDPLAKKYPLQLITPHFKMRAHSCFDNIPWLREQEEQRVWVNTADARARGIRDGDEVMAFNDRGQVILKAKVTERIMPGVVSIPEGAWYKPDDKGVDRGGCPNVLTRDEHSPGGAFVSNTALVQVIRHHG